MTSLRARAPKASSAAVRKVMQANVGRVPAIEVVVARVLRSIGVRYRKGVRPVTSMKRKLSSTSRLPMPLRARWILSLPSVCM